MIQHRSIDEVLAEVERIIAEYHEKSKDVSPEQRREFRAAALAKLRALGFDEGYGARWLDRKRTFR